MARGLIRLRLNILQLATVLSAGRRFQHWRFFLTLSPDRIKIEPIGLQDLNAFATKALNQAAFRKVVPISLLRSAAQPANPYGHPDDVALLVAFADNTCVGYQGLLAGLFDHMGQRTRVHWSTAFYVAPDYRGKGVAGGLLDAVKQLNVDFPVTRMTESARRAYASSGFSELGRLTYYQLRVEKIRKLDAFRLNGEAAPAGGRDHAGICGYCPDASDSRLYQQAKKKFYRQLMDAVKDTEAVLTAKAVDQFDSRASAVMQLPPDPPKFHRGIEAINWMLKSPWVISGNKDKTEGSNYHFSVFRDVFKYVALEIYATDQTVLKGFIVLSVSAQKGRTLVKILDFAFADAGDRFLAGYFGLKYASNYWADRLEFPESLAGYFQKHPLLQPLIKRQERLYVYYPQKKGSPLDTWAGKIALDYCDADTAFT